MVRKVCLAGYWRATDVLLDGKALTDGILKALGMLLREHEGVARAEYDDRCDATNGQ